MEERRQKRPLGGPTHGKKILGLQTRKKLISAKTVRIVLGGKQGGHPGV